MRDEDKPFICYKGKIGGKIQPRNAAGYWATLWWVLAVMPVVALFVWFMTDLHSTGMIIAANLFFMLAMGVWGIAMYRWMKARSEIVDMDELLEIKRQRDQEKKRGRGSY